MTQSRRKSLSHHHWAVALACALVGSSSAFAQVTTVITHGFSTGEKGIWVQRMAQAICARAGGGSIYRYTEATATWTYVPAPEANGSNGHVVCIFNWVPESDAPDNGPNWNYVQAAGDALYAALRDPRFAGAPVAPPASLVNDRWLHMIGHSRGACVISETALRFAREGVGVDHLTTLDPHPVNGTLDAPFNYDWNDPTPARWNNVAFLDNYWRADGGFLNALDFDGIPLAGAFNTQLNESALNCSGCGYSGAHSDVHLWLHGTIDLGPNPCDGEACATASGRASWWPEGFTQRGWYYARLGGGAAVRPAQRPASIPPAVRYVMNGDFANATHAGWSYHGGSVGGLIVNEGGAQFLKIGSGIGSSAAATHNRLWLPAGTSDIELDTRVLAAAHPAGESLRITLTDQTGAAFVVASDPIPAAAGGWVVDRRFAIPSSPSIVRNRTYTLTFAVVSSAGTAAVLGIDNVDLVVSPLAPADLTADGCVDTDDLLLLLGGWGACPAAPQWCAADINDSLAVDTDDLLLLLGGWGCD